MPGATASHGVDPVTLALVQNRLDHIARQMGWVMVRTSRSPIRFPAMSDLFVDCRRSFAHS